MPTTDEPNIAEAFPNSIPWSNGSDSGGPYGSKRIRPKVDRIKAADINQVRDMCEALLFHTHEYTDSATTVNNGC